MSMLPFIFSGRAVIQLAEQHVSALPRHSQASQLVSVSLGARTPVADTCVSIERRRATAKELSNEDLSKPAFDVHMSARCKRGVYPQKYDHKLTEPVTNSKCHKIGWQHRSVLNKADWILCQVTR